MGADDQRAHRLAYSAWLAPSPLIEVKKELAQEALSAAGKILNSAGLKSAGVALTGDAKARIIDEAKEWGADLVVVGAQGRSGIDRILQGSVSEAVAIHTHCSVEVIQDRSHTCGLYSEL